MQITDKDFKFKDENAVKRPHDVNLTWQVDYANLAAISITPIGNIYVTVNDDGVVLLEAAAELHAKPEHALGLLQDFRSQLSGKLFAGTDTDAFAMANLIAVLVQAPREIVCSNLGKTTTSLQTLKV